jgi:hypothetical protein
MQLLIDLLTNVIQKLQNLEEKKTFVKKMFSLFLKPEFDLNRTEMTNNY